MVGAFLCLLLDVFGLAAVEGAAARDRFSFCGIPFQGPLTRLGNLDSRFLVALPLSEDLLLCAKYLFIAARTMGCSRDAASVRSRTTSYRLGQPRS